MSAVIRPLRRKIKHRNHGHSNPRAVAVAIGGGKATVRRLPLLCGFSSLPICHDRRPFVLNREFELWSRGGRMRGKRRTARFQHQPRFSLTNGSAPTSSPPLQISLELYRPRNEMRFKTTSDESPSGLKYAINHVFLPPRLPQADDGCQSRKMNSSWQSRFTNLCSDSES